MPLTSNFCFVLVGVLSLREISEDPASLGAGSDFLLSCLVEKGTMVVTAMLVLLLILLLIVSLPPSGFCLLMKMEEMRMVLDVSNFVAVHLLLHIVGLVSRTCNGAVDGMSVMQIGLCLLGN